MLKDILQYKKGDGANLLGFLGIDFKDQNKLLKKLVDKCSDVFEIRVREIETVLKNGNTPSGPSITPAMFQNMIDIVQQFADTEDLTEPQAVALFEMMIGYMNEKIHAVTAPIIALAKAATKLKEKYDVFKPSEN